MATYSRRMISLVPRSTHLLKSFSSVSIVRSSSVAERLSRHSYVLIPLQTRIDLQLAQFSTCTFWKGSNLQLRYSYPTLYRLNTWERASYSTGKPDGETVTAKKTKTSTKLILVISGLVSLGYLLSRTVKLDDPAKPWQDVNKPKGKGKEEKKKKNPTKKDPSTPRPFHPKTLPPQDPSTPRPFHTKTLPHQDPFTSRPFHTKTLPLQDHFTPRPFHPKTLPPQDPSTPRPFHIKTLPPQDPSTRRPFHPKTLSHQDPSTTSRPFHHIKTLPPQDPSTTPIPFLHPKTLPPQAPTPSAPVAMETFTLSQFLYAQPQVNQAVLYSVLLVAVIVGGMRTTRRATLQLLSFSAGELWGKLWAYPPHRCLWAVLRKALPPAALRKIKVVGKALSRAVLGRSTLRKAARHKHSLKHCQHHCHRNRHLNRTITLYRRMPLKALSRLWGRFNRLELPIFLRKPLLGLYIWMFGCKLEEAEVEDLKHYRNLGEFFRRTLKPHVRPIDDDHVLTSPADGKILYYGEVRHGILEQVKGVTYSLRGFLGPQTWQTASTGLDINHQSDEDYQGDLALTPGRELHHCIIYLAPGDYHRFHSPTSWTVEHRRHFPGELLSVNPGIARWVQGLFNFNERAVYTGRWEHGFFSMAAVGATNVGSIKIYCDEELQTNVHGKHPDNIYFDKKFTEPVTVNKGDMFGEFNLGSTIVLIFEAPKGFNFKIQEGQKIKFGRPIGSIP